MTYYNRGKNLNEVWFKRDMTAIDHLRVFGTECYVHVPKQKRQKWDKKVLKVSLLDIVVKKMVTEFGSEYKTKPYLAKM